jgi:hypothetical protein
MRRWLSILVLTLPLALAASIAAPAPARADFIFGVAAEGGGLVGPQQAAMGGVGLRLGFDVAGPLSLFVQSQGFLGRLTTGPEGGSAQGLMWNSLMVDLHFGALHMGAGPSLDFAWGCTQGGPSEGCIHGAPLFGIDGRLALQFDHFVLSFDVHPTFLDGGVSTGLVGGLGWQL